MHIHASRQHGCAAGLHTSCGHTHTQSNKWNKDTWCRVHAHLGRSCPCDNGVGWLVSGEFGLLMFQDFGEKKVSRGWAWGVGFHWGWAFDMEWLKIARSAVAVM